MRILLVLCTLPFAAGAAAASHLSQDSRPATARTTLFEKSTVPLPEGVYCKMNGLEISRTEFADWLQKFRGDNYIQEYITGRLIRETAKQYNVAVTPEEVDQLIEQRLEERILGGYRGRKEVFVERELANLGRTMADYKREESWATENELLVKKILKTRRLTTDADVEREFRRMYGTSGRELWLRAILLEIGSGPIGSHKSHEEIQAIQKKAIEDAYKKGVESIKRIKSGSIDFANAALAYSDDHQSRVKGGDIGQYIVAPPEFGEDFDRIIQKAKVGDIVGPVRIQAGFVVAEITKEIVHDYNKEREKVRTALKERNPTMEEVQEFIGRLLMDARLVR
jgi:parvulin-like peptidyl-prolyl isomerase